MPTNEFGDVAVEESPAGWGDTLVGESPSDWGDISADPLEIKKSALRAEKEATARQFENSPENIALGLIDLPGKVLSGIDRFLTPPGMTEEEKAANDEAVLSQLPESSRATLQEATDRARLQERVESVSNPVTTGLRESVVSGIETMAKPSGVAMLAGAVAAPAVAGPAFAVMGIEGVKDAFDRVRKARDSGDRTEYYRAIGDFAQAAPMILGGAKLTAAPMFREANLVRAENEAFSRGSTALAQDTALHFTDPMFGAETGIPAAGQPGLPPRPEMPIVPRPPSTVALPTEVKPATVSGGETITGPDVRKGTGMPAEPGAGVDPTPGPPSPKPKIRRVAPERPWDVIDEYEGQVGGKISLTKAQELIEDFKPIGAARRLFTRKGGFAPDIAAQGVGGFKAYESDVAFLESLNEAASARKAARSEASTEKKLIKEQESKRLDFERNAFKPNAPGKPESEGISANELYIGDEFQLAGTKVKVKDLVIDPETAEVAYMVLEDGRRFDIQTIQGDRVIYPDKGTIKQKEVSTEFLPPEEEAANVPKLRPGEKGTGDLFQASDQPFNLAGETTTDAGAIAAEKARSEQASREAAEIAKKQQRSLFGEESQARTSDKSDPFERAKQGEEAAYDDLDAQFREINPDPIDYGRGQSNPNQVHTPQAFASMFNRAFAARDFDTILNAIKATSDVTIWKPFLKDLFKNQATDPIAAHKAEWFRHVFNGSIPADAIPRPAPRPSAPRPGPPPITPNPRPRAGSPPPPPRPPPTPPSPPPVRIAVEPIPGGGAKSPYQIISDFSSAIGKSIRVLRMKKNGLGIYHPGSTLTAERFAGDLDTAAHELAGHWTDDKYGVGKPWVAGRVRSPYDSELAKFWIHGSVKPTSSLRYRRAEGIAEFIRAYVVNPAIAKAEAPNFAAYFERTLPPEALKAINDFGTDVRRWAGENPLVRAGLNIRMEPKTLTQRLWSVITGRGFGFEVSPIDRLRMQFDDAYHYAVKANAAIQKLRGGKKTIPSKDFELTARLLSTHDARMTRQFEEGLVPLRPEQYVNPEGRLDVVRPLDPVTKQPMTLKWLMGAFDSTRNALFKRDMRDASAFMVAQRTVEKAGQLGRRENISGIGAGMMSDVQAARELLAEVAKDPAKEARLKEAARRYRMWANHNLDMLVDAGRITGSQAREIKRNNQQYVDMHRLSEEFDVANYQLRGGGIGTTKDVIKRFKGSSLELDNVYTSLLEQTDSIQKEAHRNVVMNNFTDGLRNVRELHGPDLKDFDQFGRKVTGSDRNTITVYKNGKAEYWQFAPEIYEALKGLGELQTNALFNLLVMPSRFARYMITRGPSFMIRNPIRDTFERSVNSRSGSKPWDIFEGYTKEDLSRYEVFGGGQFGNYIVDRHVWHREIKRVMRELTKDPRNILLSPFKLKHAWEALGETSEKLGRIAEFRRAFEAGKKKLAADNPSMSSKELDFNAALYAAGEARGLLDFAKAGTVMRHINQAIPFSNAGMRGLGKSLFGIASNPARYAMNWGLYVLAPTMAVMMWNRRDEKIWKEYMQLPAYRRDFFWNLKVGDYWMMIPKPHLLGVLAGGVERILNGIAGDPHPMEGMGQSVANTLPVSNLSESTGPLKTFLELSFNRDTFRNRDIIPMWERDLNVELRKGREHASGTGRGIASAMESAGLSIDPRNIDYILGSMGGWGNIATSIGKKTAGGPVESAFKSTGLVTESPGTNAEDVQWVLDWARKNGKTATKNIKTLQTYRKAVFDAETHDEREEAKRDLIEFSTLLRENIEDEEIQE